MNTFLAVVLVCAASVSGPDCGRDNALDVAIQPVASVAVCGLAGQVLAAQAFGAPGPGRYVRVGCERRKPA
ncbi:hypothetical protein [Methylobacterium sp. WL120]|uniref:hypothetical protein n=1 Tax=Methylobacterium sp. WL120 TaxID=2603887 RepID=UPI0011C99B2C|nr:hypothetical protein [Methylobacterium sp. WL120]TXM65740.1 hypothetical protein FV229_14685 [Methylobacterium sp. WL120]